MTDLEIQSSETITTVIPSSHEEAHAIKPGLTSIIVPVYNVNYPLFHYTGNCIGSIKEHTDAPYEIVVVDNGSPIRPGKIQEYNADKVIQNEENKGVAAAWNQGIRVSQGEYIVLLNNDTMVFDHWLSDMLEALQKADLVMATPMYGEAFSRAVEAAQKRKFWEGKQIEESFNGFRDFACVGMRRSLLEEIGTFDEQFFAYAEDLDFLRRMDKANKTYFSSKKINIFHIIGATSTSLPETPETMNESKEKLKAIWGE